jgi:hypothetical protein
MWLLCNQSHRIEIKRESNKTAIFFFISIFILCRTKTFIFRWRQTNLQLDLSLHLLATNSSYGSWLFENQIYEEKEKRTKVNKLLFASQFYYLWIALHQYHCFDVNTLTFFFWSWMSLKRTAFKLTALQ